MTVSAAQTRTKRAVDGILLLDKPPGISSNDALQRARRAFSAAKAGHTGNLDVAASGLLPVCLGEATKICGFLLDTDKRYQALVKLGEVTVTGDAEGEVISRSNALPEQRVTVATAVAALKGPQMQTPPMHSALKLNGQPLYKLARKGIAVPRAARAIDIYDIQLTLFEGPLVGLDVHCSKGTYIRVLAEQLGERLGCGAHLQALRRIAAGPFDLTQAVTLETLTAYEQDWERLDELLLAPDLAVSRLPQVTVAAAARAAFSQGQQIPSVAGSSTPPGLVRVYGEPGEFLGIGAQAADGSFRLKRMVRSSTRHSSAKTQ
jgi:tRNA pseudouridine55 synthase